MDTEPMPAEFAAMMQRAERCNWPEKRCERPRADGFWGGLFCKVHAEKCDRLRKRQRVRMIERALRRGAGL